MSSYMFMSIVFLIPFIFFLLIKQNKHNSQLKRLPPGPRRLPLIGNLHLLHKKLPQSVFEQLSNEYGPLMFLRLGSVPALVVSSAEMASEVFKTHDINFSGRPKLYGEDKLTSGSLGLSFAPYGDYWREVSKIVKLELLGPKRVQMFRSIRDEEVGIMIGTIARDSKGVINLSEVTLHLANSVVCRAAFGKKYDDNAGDNSKNEIHELLEETRIILGSVVISDYLPWMSWLNKLSGLEEKVDKCVKGLDRIYEKVIEEHRDPERPKSEHEDLVDVLLQVQSDPNQALALTTDQIKAVIAEMFIAGTDTTSSILVWIMSELIRNPLVLKKAQNEVRELIKNKGKVEECDIAQLMYLKCIIKEGLRLHPPLTLTIPRQTIHSCIVKECYIPANTMVFVHAKMIGRDPKCWDNPNAFVPERFSESLVDYNGNHYEFLPFGTGRRRCPGINFAMQVVELALANLLYCFEWELPHGEKREDLDMKEAVGLTAQKEVPLRLTATPVYL